MSDMKKLLEAMDSMAKAEKKPTGPKFPGYWKGTDPASKAKDKMVGGAQESIIKELDKTAKATATERKLKEDFNKFNQGMDEGAPELLKAEMPLVRHIEQELTNIGYKKGTPEFNAYFNDAIKFYRQFGNFGFNKNQGVAEGSEDIGNTIRQLYQQIYNQGDDALEYLNTHAPLFAQFWDQYEGDLDSIIAELSPKTLIRIAQELKQVAGQEGVAEGNVEKTATGLKHTRDYEYPTTKGREFNKDSDRLDKTQTGILDKALGVKWTPNNKRKEITGDQTGVAEGTDGVDTITVDVPLLIRLLEYAREDAQTDMDLHDVAERLIALSQEGRTLNMHDYDSICPTEQMYEENMVTPNATTTNSNNSPEQNKLQAAKAEMDKKNVATAQSNLSKLKTVAPGLNPGLANQALQGIESNPNKSVSGQQLKQTQNLADLVGDALADPQKGSQLATILQQVQTAKRA